MIRQEESFDLYFLEKQNQVQRFHVLDNDLVPNIINLAHITIGPQVNRAKYYDKLMSFLRIQTDHLDAGERRVIRNHVKQQDQWLVDGGPSMGGLWDVNDDLQLCT
ncbi:hypothetical protein BCR42DRAFT_444149 [Absidia repens]|uniref:Uncharacterized protein n=1 Tax=Absidia repens TaxID=90262 RepID=A0A1X2HXH9_9FUNG|nr:hypothetical protein BCR42DRAFT_444795 [Absidia repens]ORZ04150.1 hypothetical protein BCR42DRAFT_444360 [Absidia repens]ORZ04466.1 hypothetical protein BCR42DRAFT_444149 [Absidia repens]